MDRFHDCKSGNLGIHGDMLWDIHYTYMHCMYNQPQLLGHQIDSIRRFNREHDDQPITLGYIISDGNQLNLPISFC